MKSKKGTEESTSFLIGILLMVLILTPLIIAYINSTSSKSSMENTLKGLVEKTQKMNSGENDTLIGTIESGYFLKAFAKDDAKKPIQCKDSACICMCEPETYLVLSLWGNCAENPKCELYDKETNFRFSGGEHSYLMSESENVQLFYQKKEDVIGICLQLPCISEELQKSLDVFEDFLKKYKQCKGQNGDCICDEVKFNDLNKDFQIRMKTDGAVTVIRLYEDTKGFGETLRAEEFLIGDTLGTYNSFNDKAIEVASFDFGKDVDDKFEDYIYENSIQLFKSKEGYVTFAKVEGVGFTVLKEKKSLCQAEVKEEPKEESSSSFKKT
ncbi:MAG: hypothetical protein KJ939_04175 [Nanoarchaeota archaeon]|nr:hypothetical protein [Nanoarchaeota archaeon]